MLPIACNFRLRVDTTDFQIVQRSGQRVGQVCGGVGRGQMHREAALGQCHCHRGRESGFTDTALAHHHDEAVAGFGDLIDKSRQPWKVDRVGERTRDHRRRFVSIGE